MTENEKDQEKIATCLKETGFPPVILPLSLYEAVEKTGHDMRHFIRQQPIHTTA